MSTDSRGPCFWMIQIPGWILGIYLIVAQGLTAFSYELGVTIGHLLGTGWRRVPLGAGLGITVYLPVVCLAALVDARDAEGWKLINELPYWMVLPLVSLWGLWGLLVLMRESGKR